jgi:hypothetical protein
MIALLPPAAGVVAVLAAHAVRRAEKAWSSRGRSRRPGRRSVSLPAVNGRRSMSDFKISTRA